MISLIIPPKRQLNEISRMLSEEMGKAENIKDKVNAKSVISAMTSAKERLRLYNNRTPANGLVIYCGTIACEDGKTTKKIMIDFSPFMPINTSLYKCDSTFHVEELRVLLDNDDVYGFIIVDGSGALFGTLQGNAKKVIHSIKVSLPKKHRKGGQSSMRFARTRLEKRAAYIKKVGELAKRVFIKDNKPTVEGIIMAGAAEFKDFIAKSQNLDQRL